MSTPTSTTLIHELAEKLAACSVLVQTSGFENNLVRRLGGDVGRALGLANPLLIDRCVSQIDRALKRCANGGVSHNHPVAQAFVDALSEAKEWKESFTEQSA